MSSVYDLHAPKKPANLTVNSDLLEQAKRLKLNISAILESALASTLRSYKREEWLRENASAIAVYNEQVSKDGVFGDAERTF